ncbi:prepilin-type N-terminal cleavage/methylation domain-containing protein [bacterium]|nr:MAG: prepilin-type N-terminal cleavage/methylation domain-containing protein [bacterium]
MTTFRPFRHHPLASRLNSSARRANGFTLVEILVVIGIILLLSAILFPAFKSIQERGAQTTCASNMQQIYLAVRLYKDDEREYPANLAALLPDTETLANTVTPAAATSANVEGTGYFRKTREELVCPDDDFATVEADPAPAPTAGPGPTAAPAAVALTPVRSSYGDTSNDPTKAGVNSSETVTDNNPWTAAGAHNPAFYTASNIRDWGRLSWNYWGYDDWGQGFRTEAEAIAYFKAQPAATSVNLLRTPTKVAPTFTTQPDVGYAAVASYVAVPYFNPRGFVTDVDGTGAVQGSPYEEPRAANMFKYSLSNPQAPLSTIITHCSYHRLQTAKNVISPGADQLYDTATQTTNGYDGAGARDIVLRLDGTARSYEVTRWNSVDFPRTGHGSNWQISDF